MGYDEALVERIRAQVVDDLDVTDQRMFGGLAFLVGGRMAVAANSKGALMARVDPQTSPPYSRRTASPRW